MTLGARSPMQALERNTHQGTNDASLWGTELLDVPRQVTQRVPQQISRAPLVVERRAAT
jgi:hypothetical protein